MRLKAWVSISFSIIRLTRTGGFAMNDESLALEREKFTLEREKLSLERWKAKWTLVGIVLPLVIFLGSTWASSYQQSLQIKAIYEHQLEQQQRQSDAAMKLKAMEL